jgi:sphinganine-1-phosphate aldolase
VATDETCDVFTICDELASRGWHVRPQLSFGGFPATIHLTLSAATVPRVPEFLDAFKSSVKTAVGAGPVQLAPELVAAIRTVDLRSLDEGTFEDLLAAAGVDPFVGLPDRMATVNALLDVASPPVRQAMLTGFLDRLARPRR